jgi:EAL domain-containing protein (putative c-di-GMP-specific phosphodiesterase class I)
MAKKSRAFSGLNLELASILCSFHIHNPLFMVSHLAPKEPVLLVNQAGVVIGTRGSWQPLLGREGSELLGHHWWDYVHPRDFAEMQAVWYQVLQEPEVSVSGRCALRVREGGLGLTFLNELTNPGVRAVVITVTAVDPEVPFDEEVTQVQGCKYDLNLGLKRQEFVLYYQPVVDVATGATVGFEALMRWHHPIWGLLAPGEFIPLAEASGLMVPLGRWGLRQALHQLARWQARLPDWLCLQMHVNVSPLQLTDPGFVSDVADGLQSTGLQPQQLVLEITEGVLVGALAAVHDTLSHLRELGVLVGLDDFGTGYSSLGRLHDLAIQYLKIDRSFLLGMGPRAQAIVAAMVNLGASLGLTVVAEGVETEMQRLWLKRLGCPLAQGYLFARPLPAAQVLAFLAQTFYRL